MVAGVESRRQKRRVIERIRTLQRELDQRLSRESGPDWASITGLLDQGASPDYETANGMTCLLAAANDDPRRMNYEYQVDENER